MMNNFNEMMDCRMTGKKSCLIFVYKRIVDQIIFTFLNIILSKTFPTQLTNEIGL